MSTGETSPATDTPPPQAVSVEEDTQEPPEPQPIAEGDVLARADVVTAALRRIEALLEPDSRIVDIDAALDEREVTIQVRRGDLDAIDPTRLSARRLEDMRFPWLALDRELAAWRATTLARFDILQAERDTLRAMRAQWERTLSTSAELAFAPELSSRVESIVDQVIDVETRVRARRNVVGALSERIAASREVGQAALDRIDAVAVIMRDRMLTRDAPPLWQTLGRAAAGPFAQEAAEAGRGWWRGVRDYVALNPARSMSVVVWYAVVLAVVLRLRRHTRTAATGTDAISPASGLIERPFSLALAFTLVGMTLVLPYPTGSAIDLLFALSVVPVIRFGVLLLTHDAQRVLYQVTALTLLTRLAALGPSGSGGSRLVLLGVAGIALVLTIFESRRQAQVTSSSGLGRAVFTLTVLAGGLFAIALGANLFGWVQLSQMLTEASVASLFSAFAWWIVAHATPRLVPVVIEGGLGLLLPSLQRNGETVMRVSVVTVSAVAVIGWLRSASVRFRFEDDLVDAAARIAQSELSIGGLTLSTGGLLGGILLITVTWPLARLIRFFLREEFLPRLQLRRGSAQSLITLVNYVIWGVGIALAASAAGLTGTQLAVVVGALGVGIGFGLQNIVNNFVSGLIMIFERPIKVGDTVQTPEFWGTVQRIGIRASVIRNFDGAEISVPNGDLIAKTVTNWTRSDEIRRAEVLVGVAYGSDPDEVLDILRRVAGSHALVLDTPPIKAQMVSFGESSLDFRLRCWTRTDDWLDVLSDLHVAVNRELQASGITIPFPQRDLHIKESPAPSNEPVSDTKNGEHHKTRT